MSPNQPPYRPFQLLHALPTTIRPLVLLTIIIHLCFVGVDYQALVLSQFVGRIIKEMNWLQPCLDPGLD